MVNSRILAKLAFVECIHLVGWAKIGFVFILQLVFDTDPVWVGDSMEAAMSKLLKRKSETKQT